MNSRKKLNKKVWLIVAILLCLSVFSGCEKEKSDSDAGAPDQTAAADMGESQAAENSNEGQGANDEVSISVAMPEGWTPVEGSVLPAQYMKDTASFMIKQEAFSGPGLDEVVEQAKSSFESAFGNVQYIGDTQTVTVDGKDARKLVFTCEVSSMDMEYEYVYLFVGNDVYAITFADLAESFDSLIQDYDAILETIQF